MFVNGHTHTAAKMANNTMDAIKKKMQAMKTEKDSALDRADQLEQRVTEQKAINEKVNARRSIVDLYIRAARTLCQK